MKLEVDNCEPIRKGAFPGWPSFAEDERAAVDRVLASGQVNYWTGSEGRAFEEEFAKALGRRHGLAVANGTVALELALRACGIGPGDEVLVPSRTFVASASAVVWVGATPVFADVSRVSQNITVETLSAALSPNTRAVVAVHLAGWPCEMDGILEFAQRHDLVVIEDCAQALGATYRGRPVGSLGHVGAFSFCQDKIVTTAGEGGLLVMDDEEVWNRAWSYRDHGKSHSAVFEREHSMGFRWVHDSVGSNYRMTEVQSAVGRVQLRKLPGWVRHRRRLSGLLNAAFADQPALRTTEPPDYIGHAYYKYYVFLRPERLGEGWTRDAVQEAILSEGIPCFAGSCSEVYLERAFNGVGSRPRDRLPVARELGETSLMFLVHPTLGQREIEDTIAGVDKVLRMAGA